MLDHMLFNLQKWFAVDDNADSVIINNNQYYKAPKQIRTKEAVTVGATYTMLSLGNWTYNVVGAGNDYYIAYGDVRVAGDTGISQGTFMIKKSDCTPIWGGGKKPLTNPLLAMD